MNILAIIFTLLLGVNSGNLCYAQDASREKQVIVVRGQISHINWASSSITIRWLQTEGYVSYDEIAIFIPDSASITRGTKQIGFTQLQVGDQVTVEYVDTSPGPLKMIKMSVLVP